MDFTATSEYIPDHLAGSSPVAFENMVNILDALGNEDALSIFIYAERGIPNSKVAIQELGLTQKRFYSRLKDLIDVGLVEKSEGSYHYTTVGRIFSKIGYSLLEVLENKEQFELLERLRENSSLTPADFNKITSVVSKGSVDVSGVFNMIFFSEKQGKVEALPTYERLVEKLVEEAHTAEENIILASRYIDNKVIDATMQAVKKGVYFQVLMAKEHLEDKLNKLQLLLSPALVFSMLEFFSDPNLDDYMRDGNVPFSFCIIDGSRCFFELPSFGNHDFTIAFYVVDEDIGSRFTNMFKTLWDTADKKSIPKFIQMLNKIN